MRNDFCTDYLAHSYLAHGREWSKHKYVAKYKNGNRYIYFYSQAAYQAFLKRRGAGTNQVPSSQIGAKNYDPNAPKAGSSKTSSKSTSLSKPSAQNTANVKAALAAKNSTTNANKKTAAEVTLSDTKDKQDRGKEIAERVLNATGTSSKSKKKGSGSSSKSSGSSKKSGGGKSSSGSSKKSSGTAKEKSGSGSSKSSASKEAKTAKATTTTSAVKAVTQQKAVATNNSEPITMDTLKKVYGKEDKDISSFAGSAADLKKNMLSKYDEGSFGYLMAGNKAYKWTIENGDIVLKDYDSDKVVSFDTYLKNAKSFKEFSTSKKKTK